MDEKLFEWNERTAFAVAIMIAAYFLGRQLPRWMAGVPFLKPEEAKKGLDEDRDALVLDVRLPRQFKGADGHIRGALNMPYGELWARIKEVKEDLAQYADTRVLVVCKNDQLSARTARLLRKNGLNRVAVLEGGLKAWKKAGLPLDVDGGA